MHYRRQMTALAVALSAMTPACNSGSGISANVPPPTPTMSPTPDNTPSATAPDHTASPTDTTPSPTEFGTPTATAIPTPTPTPWPEDAVIYVPTRFETIQAAIDAADSGMEIRIEAGTYVENIDLKGKTLSIKGLGGATQTIIQGTGDGATVTMASGEATGTRLEGLTIKGGTGFVDGGGFRVGGGLYIINASPTIENCIITENSAQYGGGMAIENSEAVVKNVQVYNNEGTDFGGALSTRSARVEISGLIAWDNRSAQGGAVYLNDTLGHISNSLLSHNQATDAGGGVSLRYCGPEFQLTNNVITENESVEGAAVYFYASDTVMMGNIITYSTGGEALDADSDAYEPVITYNSFFENQAGLNGDGLRNPMLQVGNFEGDPKFEAYSADADPLNDNLFLAEDSQCVDGGPTDPQYNDIDGTRNDMGIYGGPNANDRAFTDQDDDGMPDLWEDLNGLDPNTDDADEDLDGDGLSNYDEFETGTIADNPDSDGDGILDGDEVAQGQNPTDPSDNRPIADAGGDKFAEKEEEITLDGSGSSDPNGDDLTFTWTLLEVPGGSAVSQADLDGADSDAVTFTPDADGLYRLELVVNDGQIDSAPDTVNITTSGTYYVPSDRFKSIQAALNWADDGDRILVSPGRYEENISFDGKRVRVESLAGPEETIIEAETVNGPVVSFKNNILGYDPAFPAQLVGFTVTGGAGDIREVERVGGGIFITTAAPLIENCIITGNGDPDGARNFAENGGGIYVFGGGITLRNSKVVDNYAGDDGGGLFIEIPSANITLENNLIEGNEANTGAGLYMTDEVQGLIRNNIFRGNIGSDVGAVRISDALETFAFNNNLLIENEGIETAGLSISGKGEVLGNTIVFNTSAGLRIQGDGVAEIDLGYNDVWGNGLANYAGLAGALANSNGNLSVDPEFAWYQSGIPSSDALFYLIPSSPLVDAGPPDPDLRDPDASRNDIGAYGGPAADMSGLLDVDLDGMADYWENLYGLNTQGDDGADDDDGDGLSNYDEYQYGSDPTLTDTDGDGISDGDEVLAGTDPTLGGDNQPVALVAESFIGVGIGEMVTLDGSASTDPQGDALTYQWTMAMAPEGSVLSTDDIQDKDAAIATFIPDVEGEYTVQLVVNDGLSDSAPAVVSIYASETLEVGEGGYATIQGALDIAQDNDRILVQAGTYIEDIDFKGKAIVLESIDGPDKTTIQGTSITSVVSFVSGEGPGSVLRGFTIRGGTGTQVAGDGGDIPDIWYGGGIFIQSSHPTLDNLILQENSADMGGGLAVIDGAPIVVDSVIRENEAGEYGGGGVALINAQAELSTTTLIDNAGRTAGGIWVDGGSPNLHNLIVQENRSTSNQGSGGIDINACNDELRFVNNTVVGNSGRVASSLHNANCLGLFANNIFAFGTTGPGIFLSEESQAQFIYNDVFGHVAGEYAEASTNPGETYGNISVDPLFVLFNPGDDQIDLLHLQEGSPCIDAGDPDVLYNDPDGSTNDQGAYGGPFSTGWD